MCIELLQAVFDSGAMLPDIQKSIKAQLQTIELQTESQSVIELVQEIPSEVAYLGDHVCLNSSSHRPPLNNP